MYNHSLLYTGFPHKLDLTVLDITCTSMNTDVLILVHSYRSCLAFLIHREICLGNSMIYSDIWHKYHEWYFEIVIRNFTSRPPVKFETILKYHKWYLCQISLKIMLFFVYTTTRKRFVIFACRYFKLRWNTTALGQSNWRNYSCSSIRGLFKSRHHELMSWYPKPCLTARRSVGLSAKIFSKVH